MLCLLFHDALPFLSPKTSSSSEQRQKKGDWERIVGVSDHHPPSSQSLINIRPPKPLLVIYIYIFLNLVLFFFVQNTWCPPLSFQILSCNPLLPQNQNPKTQNSDATNSDAAGVIKEAMSNPKTLTQPLKQVLEFSWDLKKKKNLFNCSWLVVLGNWNY